jgi:outer membrane protein W
MRNIEHAETATIQYDRRKGAANTVGVDIQFYQAWKLKVIDISRVAITREI